MPIAVILREGIFFPANTHVAAGTTVTLPDDMANELVAANRARYAAVPVVSPRDFTAAEVALLQTLESAHGNLANGQMIHESVPNVLVQDTAGSISTTLSQVAFATIPGGAMGLRTRLGIGAVFDLAGGDSKDLRMFAGPASGTFATATGFGGLFGLTTHRWAPLWGLVFAENSTTALRGNASGQGDWPRANTGGGSIALAIDTSLDWNIYIGVKFNAATNGNSATLRNFWVNVIG